MKKSIMKTILPANELADNEVFAPGYNDGDILILGGDTDLILIVNNSNPDIVKRYKNADNIIAINHNVADILGTDFDGDMIQISVKSNYKHFLKKVGIITGAIGGAALTIYFLNKSEFGYKAKYAMIKKLGDSIIVDNHRYFFAYYVGEKPHFTTDHIHAVGDAISTIVDPIVEAAGLPHLRNA